MISHLKTIHQGDSILPLWKAENSSIKKSYLCGKMHLKIKTLIHISEVANLYSFKST